MAGLPVLATPEQVDALAQVLADAEEVPVAPRHRWKVRQLLASPALAEIVAGEVHYPHSTADGIVWACCESTIGPVCGHRSAAVER